MWPSNPTPARSLGGSVARLFLLESVASPQLIIPSAGGGVLWQESTTWMPYISITCIIIYIIGHAIGPSECDRASVGGWGGCFDTRRWQHSGLHQSGVLFRREQTCNDTRRVCLVDVSVLGQTLGSDGASKPVWLAVDHIWVICCRSHPLRGHHRDVQAVGPARRLHGRRVCPLAVQLHRRPRLPLPRGQISDFYKPLNHLEESHVSVLFFCFFQCKQQENLGHVLTGKIYLKLQAVVEMFALGPDKILKTFKFIPSNERVPDFKVERCVTLVNTSLPL